MNMANDTLIGGWKMKCRKRHWVQLARVIGVVFVLCFFLCDCANSQDSHQLSRQFERQRQELASAISHSILLGYLGIESKETLAITDEQRRQIDAIIRDASETLMNREFSIGFGKVNWPEEYRQAFGQNLDEAVLKLQRLQMEAVREWDRKIEAVFLPHQWRIFIVEVARRNAIARNPPLRELGIPLGLAGELGLTNKEIEELRHATEASIEIWQKELAEYRRTAWKSILQSLPKDKRDQFEELVGDLSVDDGLGGSDR